MPVPSPSTMVSGIAPSRTKLTRRVLSEFVTTRFEIRRGAAAPHTGRATKRKRHSATAKIPVGNGRLDIAEHYSPTLHRIPAAGATVGQRAGGDSPSAGGDAGTPPGRALPGRLEGNGSTPGRHRILPTSRRLHALPDEQVVQRVPGIARHDVTQHPLADQGQVADDVEDLVAHDLVVEAERAVQDPLLPDPDGIGKRPAERQPLL